MPDSLMIVVIDPQKILEQFWSNLGSIINWNNIRNDDIHKIDVEDNRTIIEITIHQAKDSKKPITAQGIPYLRKGPVDIMAKGDDYKNLVSNAADDLDTEVLTNYNIEDLSIETIHEYKRLLTAREQYKKYKDLELRDFLGKIGFIAKDREDTGKTGITSGGLLFFGNNNAIVQKFPHFQLEYYDQTSTTDRWNARVSSVISDLNIFSFYQAVLVALNRTIANQFELNSSKT